MCFTSSFSRYIISVLLINPLSFLFHLIPGEWTVKKKMKLRNLFTAQFCISQLKPRSPGHRGEFNILPSVKSWSISPCPEPRSLLKARVVGASGYIRTPEPDEETIQIGIVRLGHVAKVKLYLRSIIKNSRFNYIFSLKSSFAAKIGLLIYAS